MASVVIVGMGAMGSVYAALMADAGHEVHGVCLWPDHVAAVAANGLRVVGVSGDRTVRLASVGTTVPRRGGAASPVGTPAGAPDVGAAHVGAAQVGDVHLGAAQVGDVHVAAAQVGDAPSGAAPTGAAHLGDVHIGADSGDVPVDLVIIATKSFDVEAAARAARPLVGPRTVVQVILNGLGSPQRAAAELGPDRLCIGVVGGFGASLRSPGVVHHNGMEMVRFGSYGPLPLADVERGADVWRSAGFDVKVFTDTDQMVWEKLIMNVAFSATTCLTGMTIGQVIADSDAWWLASSCAGEAVAVARAKGITLDVGDPIEHVRSLGGKIPDAKPSMLLDAQAGRRGEIDAINGAIVDEGARVGVPTPVNEALSRAVRAREATYLDR